MVDLGWIWGRNVLQWG